MEDEIFLVSFFESLKAESRSNSRVQTLEAPWVGDACFLDCQSVYICIAAFIAITLPRPLYPPLCLPMCTLLYLSVAFSPSGGYLDQQSLEFLRHMEVGSSSIVSAASQAPVGARQHRFFCHCSVSLISP